MKQFTIALVTLSLVFSTSLAVAKDHDHGHKKHDRHNAHQRGHQAKKKKHVQHHQTHKNKHRKHHGDHRKHHRSNDHARHFDNHRVHHHADRSHKRRHRSRHDKAGYLLGGMFLGAVMNEWATPKTKVVKETVYVDNRANYNVQEYSYLKDGNGHCYSVEYRQQGRVLTEVSNDFCR